jgi:endonuclease/exonuclease/phosphatase (EEP) superfamily protein YafD
MLAQAAHAQERHVLTSRNLGLPIRKAISSRNPDLLKSNGGGSNAILVRDAAIEEHRTQRLTRRPERRYAHGVRTAHGWIVNLHASTHREEWARRDTLKALEAFPAPFLFGGDINLRGKPELPGLTRLGGNHVDHLYSAERTAREVEVLDRGSLSDHPPVLVTL